MKKSAIFKLLVGSVLVLAGIMTYINKNKEVMSNLTLSNIEALAAGEGSTTVTIGCDGSGDITCPIDGSKVRDYVIFYNE